jgi:predicted metal-dependent phosphoesterase TrpH
MRKYGKMSPEENGFMHERADLHLHTTASDGRWPPEQLIDEVQRAGIGLFAVTDHDSLGSLTEISELVRGSGLCFLPGVELSARLDGQVYHLLAYGFDVNDSDLVALVAENNARLTSADDVVVQLVADAGYPVSVGEYATYTWDRRRGGWKALNYLIDQGLCRDTHDYFQRFLRNIDRPDPDFATPEEIVSVVRRAGGVVILAHPGTSFYRGLSAWQLDQLVKMGVAGLECYSSHHDQEATWGFVDYCLDRNLLITGGSDCHGGLVGRSLGVPLIYSGELKLGDLRDRAIA